MFFFGAIWLVTLLGGPFLVVLLIREVVRAVTAPRGMSAQAACDRCGYAVAGLKGTMCPECGVDLMVSGIRTPALEMRRRGHLGWALFAWTVVCGLVGMVGTSVAAMVMFSAMGGMGGGGGGATMATTTATVTTASGAAPPLHLTAMITTEDTTGAVESVNIMLMPAAAARTGGATLTYGEVGGTTWVNWTDASARMGGSSSSALDAAMIGAWVAAIRPAGAPALSDAEAQELAGLVVQAAAGTDPATAAAGSTAISVSGTSTTTTPTMSMGAMSGMSGFIPGMILLLVGAAWVAGLVLIPVRRRALRRRFGLMDRPMRPAAVGAAAAAVDGVTTPGGAG